MISIITPAYNAEKTIARTIQSALRQTYKDFELIIADDRSTDNTALIAQQYANLDSRVCVIKKDKNEGVAMARNAALDAAKGDYIAFLDSDDLWLPEKLEKQLAFMQKTRCALSYTGYWFMDANGRAGKMVNVPERMSARRILMDTSIACLTVMVDRRQSGEFRMPRLEHTEDQCAWHEIAKKCGDCLGLTEPLALYRRGGGLTGNKLKAARQQYAVYRAHFGFSRAKSALYFASYAIIAAKRHFL